MGDHKVVSPHRREVFSFPFLFFFSNVSCTIFCHFLLDESFPVFFLSPFFVFPVYFKAVREGRTRKKKALENIGFLCLTFIDVKVHLIATLPCSYALKERATGIDSGALYQYKEKNNFININ